MPARLPSAGFLLSRQRYDCTAAACQPWRFFLAVKGRSHGILRPCYRFFVYPWATPSRLRKLFFGVTLSYPHAPIPKKLSSALRATLTALANRTRSHETACNAFNRAIKPQQPTCSKSLSSTLWPRFRSPTHLRATRATSRMATASFLSLAASTV